MDSIITNTLVTGAGSFGLGYLVGWSFKKIIKWLLVIAGVIIGAILVSISLMHKYGYLTGVINYDKMGADMMNAANSTNVHMNSIQGAIHWLGLPVTGGLGLGMVAGFFRG